MSDTKWLVVVEERLSPTRHVMLKTSNGNYGGIFTPTIQESAEDFRKRVALFAAAAALRDALERLLPMAWACKHENFSDLDGKEDTRTAAIKNALSMLAKARGENPDA